MKKRDRSERPRIADERTTLTGFLDFHRDTLEWKCTGLTPDRLREQTVPPSPLSLLGLLRHMANVERAWFRHGLAGEDVQPLYHALEDRDGDFTHVEGATQADVDEAFANWREEVRRAREITAAAALDDTFVRWDAEVSVRWLLVHMIEEYARHNGHADFLRERIDGATGM